MFEGFPDELMKALAQEALTGNFHHYGVTVKVPHMRTHTHTQIQRGTLTVWGEIIGNN